MISRLKNMWRLQSLKAFINQRLTVAVEEVIGRLEKTITEYEEEMERRHCWLLDTASKPEKEQLRAGSYTNTYIVLLLLHWVSDKRTERFLYSLLAPPSMANAKVNTWGQMHKIAYAIFQTFIMIIRK